MLRAVAQRSAMCYAELHLWTLTANDIVYVNGTIIETAYYDLTAGMFGVSIQGLWYDRSRRPEFCAHRFP
jgi:hypothetical protein